MGNANQAKSTQVSLNSLFSGIENRYGEELFVPGIDKSILDLSSIPKDSTAVLEGELSDVSSNVHEEKRYIPRIVHILSIHGWFVRVLS